MLDNCVVCKKYLKDIGEQESGMCNSCDNITAAIAKEQDEELHIARVSKSVCCVCGNELITDKDGYNTCLKCNTHY